jgi:hypothetical protein
MDSAKKQLIEKLKSSNNVLVTVSRNPSVDQLAALLGFSLIVNKQGKHCAAVFSGQVPSTIEFLKPEDTFEKNTDSLRDFIIALDKSKADKLKYKVEDNIVRIFITPYRTSISESDLDFSQGDFNVDLLVALGVSKQSDLDDSITAHGRILHDAVVATIALEGKSELGSINWVGTGASSLSELVTELAQNLGDNIIDSQIATALLTGIVAETDRFRNEKTSSATMTTSATLMAAGANQQLIATELEKDSTSAAPTNDVPAETKDEPVDIPPKPKNDDGTLQISHSDEPKDTDQEDQPEPLTELPEPAAEEPEENKEDVTQQEDAQPEPEAGLMQGPKLVTEPPSMGGTLTANSQQNVLEPSTDPFSVPQAEQPQILERKDNTLEPLADQTEEIVEQPQAGPGPEAEQPVPDVDLPSLEPMPQPEAPQPTLPPIPTPDPVPEQPSAPSTPPPADNPLNNYVPPANNLVTEPITLPQSDAPQTSSGVPQLHIDEEGTLSQIEESVNSPHVHEDPVEGEDAARAAVNQAFDGVSSQGETPQPIESLNSQPLGPDLHPVEPEVSNEDDSSTAPKVAPPLPPSLLNPPKSS